MRQRQYLKVSKPVLSQPAFNFVSILPMTRKSNQLDHSWNGNKWSDPKKKWKARH